MKSQRLGLPKGVETQQGGHLQECELPKALNLKQESSSTIDEPI